MARAWELKFGNVTVMPRLNHPGDLTPDHLDTLKLRLAITYASQMVDKAYLKLRELSQNKLQNADELEVQYALAKYFSIHPSDDMYTSYVQGILNVYRKIKVGMMLGYDIVVFDPTDRNAFRTGALGYVRPTRTVIQGGLQTSSESPIRKLVGIPDEWNHREWTGYAVGRIHLSLGILLPGLPEAYDVARTIVHEASHKFAGTNDILYKHQSFGKSPQMDLEKEGYVQATMAIGGKVITPMAGAATGEIISPHLYIENADSYAWTARRLWKRFRTV